MVFSSTLFLLFFLPIVLLLHSLVGIRCRNFVLLLASLSFYSWGEGLYVTAMLYCIAVSWWFGCMLDKTDAPSRRKKLALLAVCLNLLPLLYFKYTVFLVSNISRVLGIDAVATGLTDQVYLPIGISFFTFQALSYVIDIYHRKSTAQQSIFDLGLYISLFPQLIAGPIVRYHDIDSQLKRRICSVELFASGCERFIFGLGKKVLIANQLGWMADTIFAIPTDELSTVTAWFGVAIYALQIYFDFSGYSDMAIGLGRMLGFRFLENFNYPYISQSIKEFWRRWHISLSRWFRDYVYIPLGGNRASQTRVMWNLLLVFLLCGLWHGASWNFVLWGLIHGFFLMVERTRVGNLIARCPATFRHLYVLLIVLIAWVFFRTENLGHATQYLGAMFYGTHGPLLHTYVWVHLDRYFLTAFFLALILSTPIFQQMRISVSGLLKSKNNSPLVVAAYSLKMLSLSLILILAIFDLAAGSYNPFIYFRF